MHDAKQASHLNSAALASPPTVEVVIEIPRGSFLKRGSTGQVAVCT